LATLPAQPGYCLRPAGCRPVRGYVAWDIYPGGRRR
jgi:hypothetical protein